MVHDRVAEELFYKELEVGLILPRVCHIMPEAGCQLLMEIIVPVENYSLSLKSPATFLRTEFEREPFDSVEPVCNLCLRPLASTHAESFTHSNLSMM